MKDTRIDGVDFPSEDRFDGIYEGANVFDIRAIASYDDAGQASYDGAGQVSYDGAGKVSYDGAGQASTESTLPVLVTRGAPHPRTQERCVALIKSLKSNSLGVLAL